MITRRSLSTSKISHVVTAEIFEEVNSNFKLPISLKVTFGASSLNCFNEEIPDFFILHGLNNLSANLSQHQVSFLVLERIVQS
jgi:hypothetical protein